MPTEPPTELEKLQDLHTKAQGKHNRAARAVLGHRKVSLGFATAGLRDLLIATDALNCEQAPAPGDLDDALADVLERGAAGLSDDPSILAKFGEALRVYARDVQLSRAQDKLLGRTVKASIECFDKALASYSDQVELAAEKAWLLAHRGAALMMIYWLDIIRPGATGDNELFEACKADFEAACALKSQYTWSIQFNAFLHALRGEVGDFDYAVERLKSLPAETRARPTIQRSLAMLYSYNAAPKSEKASVEERRDAAQASLNAALNAQKDDQDEFLGSYSGAASSWALFDMAPGDLKGNKDEDKEKQRLLQDAQASCETAEIRARNAISQALVALVGLTFVRGKLAQATGDEAALKAAGTDSQALQLLIKKSQFRDLESQAMVRRDPVWRSIKDDADCSRYFLQPGFDELRNFTPPTDHSAL